MRTRLPSGSNRSAPVRRATGFSPSSGRLLGLGGRVHRAPIKPPAAADRCGDLEVAHAEVEHQVGVQNYLKARHQQAKPCTVIACGRPALSPVVEPVASVLDFPRERGSVEFPCVQNGQAATRELARSRARLGTL